ncbi:MAG: DUF169 domain-containing protein [Pirellulaceae bacterium]
MNDGSRIDELLGLRRAGVAVSFQETAPDGLPRIDAAAVAGCKYWKLAAEGHSFYTEASAHYGCPIGSHTHGIELPTENAQELESMLGTMVQLEYIDMDEVSGIPQLDQPFGVAIYTPLADAETEPDVVIISGNAKQMMLLGEAVHAAGLATDALAVGRPTCAAIPAVIQSGAAATNLGCIGNRVYSDLADDELYFALAGSQLASVVDKLITIIRANQELESFHTARNRN